MKFNENLYLIDMYKDKFYPQFLVDKVKKLIVDVVDFLEHEEYDLTKIQAKFDEMTIGINNLQDEFYENESEIETVARDSIAQTIEEIINHFKLDLDLETALQEREW